MTAEPTSNAAAAGHRPRLAVVLTGGGARGAYQVGVLRGLGRLFPDLRFPIVTGVSAGAINAVWLASRPEGLGEAAEALVGFWRDLDVDAVFRTDVWHLGLSFLGWMTRMGLGGSGLGPRMRGFLDTAPLRELLERLVGDAGGRLAEVQKRVAAGELDALALTTVNYGTGRTVTWVEGRDVQPRNLPLRVLRSSELTVDHVMASAALPLLFPAVHLGDGWYGDGGVRLAAPLSPALHLGADRLLAISTRYHRSLEEAQRSAIDDYPPPAQIAGNLLNSVFLDILDQDVRRLERFNGLVRQLEDEKRQDLRAVDLVLVRPSEDLGAISAELEPRLPGPFRFFTRSFGTRETRSPDFLSLVMFQHDYVERLIAIGERDALARADDLRRLVLGDAEPSQEDSDDHDPV